MNSVLIVGLNCRPVAIAAKELGLKVAVVDFFGDVDLMGSIDRFKYVGQNNGKITSLKNYSPEMLVNQAKIAIEEFHPDGLLLTSEIGCNPRYAQILEKLCPIIGNDSEKIFGVRNWMKFFERLDEIQISHPTTFVARARKDIERAIQEIKFPLITKPIHGSAGFGVRLANTLDEIFLELEKHGEILIQEYIEGTDASVSIISSNEKSRAISLNEQLLGISELNSFGFQYCGNIVPLQNNQKKDAFGISERICREFGLLGSNGIDFVLADRPYVIEVNPRFQDTQDCIQRVFGINIVKSHLDAILHDKISKIKPALDFSAKGIYFADETYKVDDLTRMDGISDIPSRGSVIPVHNPLCSLFSEGVSRNDAFYNLKNKVQELKTMLK